ncbi:MAG: hypothetical protein JWM44_742 [Bacilli bacterium]|nr:hypothetical protein [Bacilli bacterium]
MDFNTFYQKHNFQKILIQYGDELIICCLIERILNPQNKDYFKKLQQLKNNNSLWKKVNDDVLWGLPKGFYRASSD